MVTEFFTLLARFPRAVRRSREDPQFASQHVKRTDDFPNCADIMVNSTYWPETGEVAAFEELVGSHGGLGGPQSYPFVLVPRDWALPKEPIIGAEAMHLQMRRWLSPRDPFAESVVF
jgi:hypothetical protein